MAKGPKLPGGPRKRQSRPATGTQEILSFNEYQISFDPKAFDNFIRSQGIWVTHLMAIPDPRGMASRGDNRDVLSIRPKDTDGFIYVEAGSMQVLFTNNSKNVSAEDLGELAFSTAFMTMPRYYDGTTKSVVLHSWDRFYLKDIEIKVSETQYIEASRDGKDRLSYPAVEVQALVDSNGVNYKQDIDFNIDSDGDIHWLGQKRPGWNTETGRGTVYSVRYLYTPYFIVNRLMHEIRVAQITDPATFKRSLERMPYQVQVVREIVFKTNDTNKDPAMVDPRTQYAPQVGGSLGPINPSVGGTLGPSK